MFSWGRLCAPAVSGKGQLGYDAVNDFTDIIHPFGNGSKTFHRDCDAVGNRPSAHRNGGTADGIGYDKNSYLTSFLPRGGTTTTSTLDASGNRSYVNGANYISDYLNEYMDSLCQEIDA